MAEIKFESWAIIEIMGHQRLAGRCSEEVIAGAPLLRVDVPTGDGPEDFRTEYLGAGSIYRLHPTNEAAARAAAKAMRANRPHYAYEVDSQLRLEQQPAVALTTRSSGNDFYDRGDE
jgi:hypothetical protein